MELVRSLDDISRRNNNFSKGYILSDANMVMVTFRTNAEIVKKVLPPPLEPTLAPTGLAYVAEFHKTNFGTTYNEAGLFLSAQYNRETGKYCLSMPVTNDMAMVWGREIYGYPKKIADNIRVTREGNKVTGICVRKGIPIIEINVKLTKSAKPEAMSKPTPNYLFKYFWNPEGKLGKFDYTPCLIKQSNEMKWGTVEMGEGKLTFTESKYDPIYEIPIEEVLTAYYTKGLEVQMQSGEVVAEVEPMRFLPYSFNKYDWELI